MPIRMISGPLDAESVDVKPGWDQLMVVVLVMDERGGGAIDELEGTAIWF